MENNNKPLNPIERARQQANINKQSAHGVKPGDIDIFGNTEPVRTNTVKNDFSSNSVYNQSFEDDSTHHVVAEEERVYTIGGDGIEGSVKSNTTTSNPIKNDSFIQPIHRSEPITTPQMEVTDENPFNTAEPITPLNLDQENISLVDEPIIEEIKEESSENPVEQKKKKKEKTVRIIKENQTAITPESIKEGRKVAWLAYILFFIPLLINKNNSFVRHNANEGLEIFIFDVLGAVLLILNAVINSASFIVSAILLVGSLVGVGLLILTTITKIYMIIVSLSGKICNTPWFWNIKIIK